jgi:hypothetical protein
MKKYAWILVVLLCVSLILFPKRCNMRSFDNFRPSESEKITILYLSPIWSDSYENHLIVLSPLPQSTNPNVTYSTYAVTDFNGKVKEPESKPAIDIWIIYYLFPSFIIASLLFIFGKRKSV